MLEVCVVPRGAGAVFEEGVYELLADWVLGVEWDEVMRG